MMRLRYLPTREEVTLVGIANEGQTEPGDPGRGMRLYRVEKVNDQARAQWQAEAGELQTEVVNDSTGTVLARRRFDEREWVPRVEHIYTADLPGVGQVMVTVLATGEATVHLSGGPPVPMQRRSP